ncbi:MAG: LytTR family DNA-binding domain-containing protein [Kofleriaceae bacterium]
MRVLVVDDEPLARDGMRILLAEHPDLELVGEAGNGAEALGLVDRLKPDLLLIDVQMPQMSGLELAAHVAATYPQPPAFIFVTAYDEFALGAFEVHALDYVLKPIDEQRFAEAIRRARLQHHRVPGKLALRDGDTVVFVPIEDIDWVEAADYYVEIHVGGKTFLHRETLQRLQTKLDPDRFLRIHRSRLVNRDRVREIRWEGRGEMVVVTTNGVSLRVARSCRAKLSALR